MNDIDAAIAAELERMVPVGAEPDWDAIARAAGLGRRRLGHATTSEDIPGTCASVPAVIAWTTSCWVVFSRS